MSTFNRDEYDILVVGAGPAGAGEAQVAGAGCSSRCAPDGAPEAGAA